jgi:hypothetical protein
MAYTLLIGEVRNAERNEGSGLERTGSCRL